MNKIDKRKNAMYNDEELSEMLRVFFTTRKRLKVDPLSETDRITIKVTRNQSSHQQ